MGWFAIAGMVISGVMAAKGQQDAAAQQKYQGQVAANNVKIANQKAEDALVRGELDERKHRVQIAAMMGEQRGGAAARGVLVDEGSALDQVADTAAIGELEALTIRSNAEREALGFRQQAAAFAGEEAFLGSSAKSLQSTSLLAGLGASAGVAAKWSG